jgi:C-terminal processing protease CtpA/Prc
MNRAIKQFFPMLAIALLFTACGSQKYPHGSPGGDDGGGNNNPSFSNNEKAYLYNLFLTEYYWYDKVPEKFDYSSYTEPKPMIDDLKYADKDRWSFAMTKQEYNDFAEQKTAGFGFGYTPDMFIYMVRIDSPADKAGLMRGDLIVEVNGQAATPDLIAKASSNLNQMTRFTVDRSGVSATINITAKEYNFKVASSGILKTPDNTAVGYLRFDSFTDNATDELESIFTDFKKGNIDRLVIDLRYNGGGYLNTASILLDKLVRGKDGKVQFKLAWNAKNSSKDEVAEFETDDNSLDLKQILFLTTQKSASASELVINALYPYLGDSVIIVGDKTHGKPVGMAGRSYGNHVYFLINFLVENADGFSDYFEGLPADCSAVDDFSHQMGDPEEAMLKEALYYIDNGSC